MESLINIEGQQKNRQWHNLRILCVEGALYLLDHLAVLGET